VKVLRTSHQSRGLLVHKLTTYGPWRNRILVDGETDVRLYFQTGERLLEALIDVDQDRNLFAEVTDVDSGRVVGYGRAWRPSRRTLQVEVAVDTLGNGLSNYEWSAVTGFHEDGHTRCGEVRDTIVSCTDRAPNRGMVRHDI
jgi:hypothetical protein